jgi:hypothetical protein
VLKTLAEKAAIDDDIVEALREATTAFKETFLA